MKAADFLMIPSRYEGLGYTMIGGLAAGLQIVSTVVPGASMSVVDGQNDYIVLQDSHVGLAAACDALLNETDLALVPKKEIPRSGEI